MQSLLQYQHKLLDTDEFLRLVVLAQAGDVNARNTIIEHNIKLVLKNAFAAHKRLDVELEDLIQFGIIGMIRAIEKYDASKINEESGKPYAFSTYATWWIRQYMDRETAMSNHFVRLPIHIIKKLSQFRSVLRYMMTMEIPITDENIDKHVAEFNFSSVELYSFKHLPVAVAEIREFNSTRSDDQTYSIYENTIDESSDFSEAFSNEELALKLRSMCADILTQREFTVIQLRFGLNDGEALTLEETGNIIGVTRERVRQLQVAAIKKLKIQLIRELGNDYVETAFG